jgi:hypothetical protein
VKRVAVKTINLPGISNTSTRQRTFDEVCWGLLLSPPSQVGNYLKKISEIIETAYKEKGEKQDD